MRSAVPVRETSALRRARLGAALRRAGSEVRDTPLGGAASAAIPDDVRAHARQIEQASPGLALMMHLRARLFEHAVRTAAGRGFRLVVTIGCGFVRPRLRRLVGAHARLVEIEHPDVVASARARRVAGRAVVRVAVPAFDDARAVWRVLVTLGCDPTADRTLFLLEGLSLWGGEGALGRWLRLVDEAAAPGTEIVANLLDDGIAAHARRAANGLAGLSGSPAFGSGAGAESEPDALPAGRLQVVQTLDSADVQRAAAGVADSFVRERYLWLRVPSRCSTQHPVPCVAPRAALFRRSPDEVVMLPRLRSALAIRDGASGAMAVTLPVTALRAVVVPASEAEIEAAALFDGRRSIPRVAGMLRRAGRPRCDVAALALRLWTRGFVAGTGEDGELGALRAMAFAVLERGDGSLARRVSHGLAAYRGNAAARHLRAIVQTRPWPRLARDGTLAVLTPATGGAVDGAAVLAAAHGHLKGIRRLLGVRLDAPVLIDLSSARSAMPLTIVGEAEPYTLVRIPSTVYSTAILCHELVHTVAVAGSPWLTEGLAVWVQRSLTADRCYPDDGSASVAVRRHSLDVSLVGDATGSPDRPRRRLERADYLEAAAFVEWLVRRAGAAAMVRLFGACRLFCPVAEMDTAVAALGWPSLRDLDAEWKETTA